MTSAQIQEFFDTSPFQSLGERVKGEEYFGSTTVDKKYFAIGLYMVDWNSETVLEINENIMQFLEKPKKKRFPISRSRTFEELDNLETLCGSINLKLARETISTLAELNPSMIRKNTFLKE